jgi:inward rectifier potassium channel
MAIHRRRKINPEDDLGFGTQPVMKNQPLVNKDGTVNIKRKGLSIFNTSNNYHTLITMSWTRFWLLVLAGYVTVNVIFAFIYVGTGLHLDGAEGHTPVARFLDALFFSAQTISTVGYGHISPRGITTNSIAALESMMGLLAFALATGLLYGRFSRPSAKIIYSKNILVAPYLGKGRGLMFRLVNKRRNILLDLEIEIIFSFNDHEANGKVVRRFYPLEVERKYVSLLSLNWTVVHPLDENSPIKDLTHEDMIRDEAGFAILLRAFDDTFSQTVHSRTFYLADDVKWGAKFKPVFDRDPDGRIVLDLSKISDHELVELPVIDSLIAAGEQNLL